MPCAIEPFRGEGGDVRCIDVHLEQFDRRVLETSRRRPVLVDFWADWCRPCLVLAPVLEQALSGFGGRVLLAKVEVDAGENMKLAGHYRLRGFPTVILFRGGEEVARFTGARPQRWIRDFLQRHLPGPGPRATP